MKAVLYLKELTTIVQNQQSLIQTQRQRIDELERKVEDLIGENRQLKDPHPPHHYRHHRHPSPRSTSPQPAVPQPQLAANRAVILPAQPPQQVQSPPTDPQPPPPPPPHQPQHLQLVPTSPQSPLPGQSSPESAEEDKKSPCCKSLVPQTPTTLCRSVGLARKAENQTVLHQFCCPAPEAPEGDSTSCSTRGQDLSTLRSHPNHTLHHTPPSILILPRSLPQDIQTSTY
ncbi:hypothetical protein AAFF_G00076500 [Aldrovandia affinis]|uniref:Uncharacterized protein n=1 Tax=Aldrovandia affinis TaxID=143900 RepID=A0AAD7S0B7_9TELE|nr:hypothetical protein AAFF_G00076500 [Aldrovandia affinis]